MTTLTIPVQQIRKGDRIVAASGHQIRRPMVAAADYEPAGINPPRVVLVQPAGSTIDHVFYPETGRHTEVTVERARPRRFTTAEAAARALAKAHGVSGTGGGYIGFYSPDGAPITDSADALPAARALGLGRKAVRYADKQVAYIGATLPSYPNVVQGWSLLAGHLARTGRIRQDETGRWTF